MTKTKSYTEILRQDLSEQIDRMPSSNSLQKDFLKSRWLDQTLWFEARANTMQKWYRRLRLVVVIGGVIIPTLVGLNFTNVEIKIGERKIIDENGLNFITLCLSLCVASSAAIEEFFNFGERYRNYRKSAESLKSEWWKFQQSIGEYSKDKFDSPEKAYAIFVEKVEQIIAEDVKSFIDLMNEELAQESKDMRKIIGDMEQTNSTLQKLNLELSKKLEGIPDSQISKANLPSVTPVNPVETNKIEDASPEIEEFSEESRNS